MLLISPLLALLISKDISIQTFTQLWPNIKVRQTDRQTETSLYFTNYGKDDLAAVAQSSSSSRDTVETTPAPPKKMNNNFKKKNNLKKNCSKYYITECQEYEDSQSEQTIRNPDISRT